MGRVHPRDRAMIHHDRPMGFGHRGPHYFGHRIDRIPPHYTIHHYWGVPYYSWNGIWYRRYADYYYVCRPPFGVYFVPDLVDLTLGLCSFAYYCDRCRVYDTIDENARTIVAQNEAIAANNALLASQNAQLALNQQQAEASGSLATSLGLVQSYADAATEYYYDDGVFFVKDSTGQYMVIVPPAGAIVKELPEDYETVVLNGQEYYRVDNTVYRMIVVEGAACFEVLGQLTGSNAR